MRIRVFERSGEIGKMGDFLNYELTINLGSPGFKERFLEEREKAHKKYLKMKRRIIKKMDQKELDLKVNFIRYNAFIKVYNGDIEKWKEHLKRGGSIDVIIDDYQFVYWLGKKIKEDPGLIDRIEEMLKQVEKEFSEENKISQLKNKIGDKGVKK